MILATQETDPQIHTSSVERLTPTLLILQVTLVETQKLHVL